MQLSTWLLMYGVRVLVNFISQKLKSKYLVCLSFIWWQVFLREREKIFYTHIQNSKLVKKSLIQIVLQFDSGKAWFLIVGLPCSFQLLPVEVAMTHNSCIYVAWTQNNATQSRFKQILSHIQICLGMVGGLVRDLVGGLLRVVLARQIAPGACLGACVEMQILNHTGYLMAK